MVHSRAPDEGAGAGAIPSPKAANRFTGGTRKVALLTAVGGGPPPWPVRPGRAEAAAGQPVPTGRHPRRRRNEVSGVPVQTAVGTFIANRGPRVSVGGGFLDISQRNPASSAAVTNAGRSVCGLTRLLIPARPATRRTIRAAPRRSSRRPSVARKIGPSLRSPMARSIARAVRGASGMVTILPPLAGDGQRPVPPSRGTRSPGADGEHGRPGNVRAILLRPRTVNPATVHRWR
jgi:hypothetical protein